MSHVLFIIYDLIIFFKKKVLLIIDFISLHATFQENLKVWRCFSRIIKTIYIFLPNIFLIIFFEIFISFHRKRNLYLWNCNICSNSKNISKVGKKHKFSRVCEWVSVFYAVLCVYLLCIIPTLWFYFCTQCIIPWQHYLVM